MYKIIGSRGCGKTHQLILYAINNDCDIIVGTKTSEKYINNMLNKELRDRELSPDAVKVYGIYDYLNARNRSDRILYNEIKSRNKKFVIDEIDFCIKGIIPELKGYTMSIE